MLHSSVPKNNILPSKRERTCWDRPRPWSHRRKGCLYPILNLDKQVQRGLIGLSGWRDRATCLLLNRSLQGAELNYSLDERHWLALIFATDWHYFLVHPLLLVIKSNPLRWSPMEANSVWSNRLVGIQLSEFDITIVILREFEANL